MGRYYNDFLSAYLQYSERSEPPLNYHIWTCLSIIGAALQRKVHLRWGFNTIFPNMYVVLIGPSACGKGLAMRLGKDILASIPSVSIACESITREALIQDIKASATQFIDEEGFAKDQSAISVFSEELSVFLGQQNIKFIADLTDWFDCKDTWTYRTKGSGTDTLNYLCVSILGASAPDWLRSILPMEAYGGGFTSRIILVVEEGKKQRIADPSIPQEILDMKQHLVNDLEQISLLSGVMKFHEKTMSFYKEWYEAQDKKPAISDPTFAGYCERRALHALKLSIICSVSRSDEKIILREDFERALALLEAVEPKMPRAFMGLGKARYAEQTVVLLSYLEKVKRATAAELLEKYSYDIDEYTLQVVMKTLLTRGRVEIHHAGLDTYYTYKEKEE